MEAINVVSKIPYNFLRKCQNLGRTMTPKTKGVEYLFYAPNETENINISLRHIGQVMVFGMFLSCWKDLEDKTYPASDLHVQML